MNWYPVFGKFEILKNIPLKRAEEMIENSIGAQKRCLMYRTVRWICIENEISLIQRMIGKK